MPQIEWFIHLQGETFGPISTEIVQVMLKQNRLNFADFVWTKGLTRWARLVELPQFATFMPAYPILDPPGLDSKQDSPLRVPPSVPKSPASTVVDPAVPAVEEPASRPPAAKTSAKAWIRRHSRVSISATAKVEGAAETFPVVDISEGGVFLETKTPISFGTNLKLAVESSLFPRPLELTGIVIREGESEDGHHGFAVQFTRMNPAYRRAIQDYVKNKK